MTEAPRSDPRIARTLTFAMLTAMNRTAREFAGRFGAAHDLALPEWRCLMALAAQPDASGEEVARLMGMDKMAVSRALRRLEDRGRVAASADPAHRRRRLWQMTPDGWAVYDAIVPAALERDAAAFGDLGPAERAQVAAALARFMEG